MPYNPGSNYGQTPAPSAAGQGQTALETAQADSIPANTSGTSSGSAKYFGQLVPGSQTVIARAGEGSGVRGQVYDGGKTLGQMQADLYDLGVADPDTVAALQTQLIKAGLLSPTAKNFSLGSVSAGDPTDKAYMRLLTEAIKTGGDYNVMLSTLATNPKNTRGVKNWDLFQRMTAAQTAQASGAGTTTSQSFNLTDPNHARQLVKDALANRLGRTATPDDISQFTNSLRQAELSAPSRETDTYAGGGAGLPTTRVSYSTPPDPAAMADAFAVGTQPRANEAGAQSEVGFMNVLQRLVGNRVGA